MLHRRSFLIGALAASVGGIPAYADALADETIHARWLAPALRVQLNLTVFLETCLGRRQMPLRAPVARLHATRRPTDVPGHEMGLGWFISNDLAGADDAGDSWR